MKKKNSALIGAIIIEGHVQGLSNTRSLGKEGIPVIVVDKNDCIARYSKFCQGFFKCPDFSTPEFINFLIDLAQKEELKDWVLLPSNDHAVKSISQNKTALEVYYKVITPKMEIINNIYDKSKLIELAERIGIPVPKTQYFSSIEDALSCEISFPVLTKGKQGLTFYKTFGKKAFLASTKDLLKKQLQLISSKYDLTNTFTQELIPVDKKNKTVSFTAFCINGEIKTYWMGIKIREHPIQFGTATLAKSINIPECLTLATILLKELSFTGVCEVEFLKDPRNNKYNLIEINARTWLWVGLARACGVDYAKIIYKYITNGTIAYPKSYTQNVYWVNPITDLIYSLLGIISGKIGISEYIKSLFTKPRVNALFSDNDFKPGVAYIFKLFSFSRNR